jgi:hypothetical protein
VTGRASRSLSTCPQWTAPSCARQLLILSRDPDRVTAAQATHALILRGERRAIRALADEIGKDPDDATPLLLETAQAAPEPPLLPGLHQLLRSSQYQNDTDLTALISQIEQRHGRGTDE